MPAHRPITNYRPYRVNPILTEAERDALDRLAQDARHEGNLSRAVGWALRVADLVAKATPNGPIDPAAALEAWAKIKKA